MIELAATLNACRELVRRYVVLSETQLCAVALWIFHTHVLDAAQSTPYLQITSATRESGKTRLLEVLDLLVARAWMTGRVTAAVLARKIDKETPTLVLDESDTAFNSEKEYAEALRGILNSGYRRSGKASVCVGQGANISYVDLSTFNAKAIAGIGNLPDTVASRSIPVRLKRRAPDEPVARFHERRAADEAEPLYQALVSLGVQYEDRLKEAEPELLAELPDRAADVWEPLLAIADLAGEGWPERARLAAVELSGRAQAVDQSESIRLLADCRAAFNGHDRLATKDLIAILSRDEEAPWGTWHRGGADGRQPISPRALAGQLEPFGIRSRSIRLDDGSTPKGFHVDQFSDAWKRYLESPIPPDSRQQTPHPPQPASEQGSRAVSHPPQDRFVVDRTPGSNPHGKPVVADVADRPPETAGEVDFDYLGTATLGELYEYFGEDENG